MPPMILTSYFLKALLALILAFLGGALLRNVRGLGREQSRFERNQDRLLGASSYVVSIFLGVVACQRITAVGEVTAGSLPLLPVAAIFAACWLAVAGWGLRRTVTLTLVRYAAIGAVIALALLLVVANGRIIGADVFLGLALMVWLVSTLLFARPLAK